MQAPAKPRLPRSGCTPKPRVCVEDAHPGYSTECLALVKPFQGMIVVRVFVTQGALLHSDPGLWNDTPTDVVKKALIFHIVVPRDVLRVRGR
jgi:hypothetical protein